MWINTSDKTDVILSFKLVSKSYLYLKKLLLRQKIVFAEKSKFRLIQPCHGDAVK